MKGYFKSALTVSLGLVVAKILGAFYRIPLMKLLGANGIGIYQMAFPFYCLLLTISSTGIPSGLSKLVASGYNAEEVLQKSLKIFGSVGLVGSLLMCVLAKRIALWQGNSASVFAFVALSPSVFAVSLLSAFRGYFQGQKNMLPTAVSQIIEQAVKLAVGLSLAYFLSVSTSIKAGLCCGAVTISEYIALFYVVRKFKKSKKANALQTCKNKNIKSPDSIRAWQIIKLIVPITLSTLILPLSKVIDSFLIINLMPTSVEIATSSYGLYSGAVESLVAVPVSLCYGVAISAIPFITSDKNSNKSTYKTVILTILLSVTASIAVYFASNLIVEILYGALSEAENILLKGLLKTSAVQIVLLALVQTFSSVLIARDSAWVSPISLSVGLAVKIIAVFLLVPSPQINVYGLAISDILCYFVAVCIDLLYIIINGKKKKLSFSKQKQSA